MEIHENKMYSFWKQTTLADIRFQLVFGDFFFVCEQESILFPSFTKIPLHYSQKMD